MYFLPTHPRGPGVRQKEETGGGVRLGEKLREGEEGRKKDEPNEKGMNAAAILSLSCWNQRSGLDDEGKKEWVQGGRSC